MGCSSSSTQTIDQEKKPGTKPEESNGSTLAARSSIATETIEDKTQLPVSALADDLQQVADDGSEATLMAIEAQEDLGSGENLLTDLEPQPDPFSPDEPCSVAVSAEASSDSGFADVAVEAVERLMAKPLSEEEIQAMGECEMEQTEVPAKMDDECCKTDDPVQQDDPIKGEALAVEEMKAETPPVEDEPVQAEVPAVPAGAFPESFNPVDESEAQEAVAEVSDDAILSLESETEKSPPLPALLTAESLASTETALNEVEPVAGSAASVEDSTIAKSSEVKEAIIDPGIAVATIPEMPPLVPVSDEMQAAVDESIESVVMPSESALQAEASGPAETTSLKEPALVLDVPVSSTLLLETSSNEESEVASAFGASPSSVMSDCTVEVHAAEPTQTEIEANSPITAADQASESSTEVMSAAECHQGLEKNRAKKEE
ncbi:uncharacterized protein [Syngnathus scovelli]|uniref:uncharacterized protein n=1 Tax=Syngnathus scovelli TaxID=161590 RepID=UPI00210F9E7E|nr:fibrous sheath CABYR-binding protein [Syngnathus scovelli]XP_049585828.1 fibrous sheath CABYR-binding protein [Syngnathus scovelli]